MNQCLVTYAPPSEKLAPQVYSCKWSGGYLLHNGYLLRCGVIQLAGELKGGLTSHGITKCSVCGGFQVSITLVVSLLTVLEMSGG